MSASLPPCPSTFKGSQAGHPCFWRAGNRSVGMDGMSPTRAGEGKRCGQGAEQPAARQVQWHSRNSNGVRAMSQTTCSPGSDNGQH